MEKYPIPKTTRDYLLKGAAIRSCNRSLFFDRFLQFSDDWQMKDGKKEQRSDSSQMPKTNNLNAIINVKYPNEAELINALNDRWEAMVKSQNGETIKYKTSWRFITGVGKKNAMEVGFLFDRYGFPNIPGSSLKGLTRAYALHEVLGYLDENQIESLSDIVSKMKNHGTSLQTKTSPLSALEYLIFNPDENIFSEIWRTNIQLKQLINKIIILRKVTGTQNTGGLITFFDAIPDRKGFSISQDIMNPHFPDYFKEVNRNTYPTDNQKPVPIKFLSVLNTIFNFGMAVSDDREGEKGKIYLNQTIKWLENALATFGAGAKTNAGYGYFEDVR